jgi:hypothetical protein
MHSEPELSYEFTASSNEQQIASPFRTPDRQLRRAKAGSTNVDRSVPLQLKPNQNELVSVWANEADPTTLGRNHRIDTYRF